MSRIGHRREAKAEWKRAFLIAGHSHLDHANNFCLSNVIGAPERHTYIHESGFQDGRVKNEPVPFIESVIDESKKYYDPYLAFPVSCNLPMVPFMALDALSPALARKVFAIVGGIPFPGPADGSSEPVLAG